MTNIKFTTLRFLFAGLCILGVAACSNNPKNANDNTESNSRMKHEQMADRKDDSTFVAKANGINLEEIKMGTLAKEKSNSDAIKELGNILVNDHTNLKQKLNDVADKKSINLSGNLSDDAQEKYNKLNELSGEDFNEKFADMMVDGHQNAIDLFEKDSAKTNDSDIREYINKALPLLRKHLAVAKEVKDNLKDNE